jgi:hypothetical protein
LLALASLGRKQAALQYEIFFNEDESEAVVFERTATPMPRSSIFPTSAI